MSMGLVGFPGPAGVSFSESNEFYTCWVELGCPALPVGTGLLEPFGLGGLSGRSLARTVITLFGVWLYVRWRDHAIDGRSFLQGRAEGRSGCCPSGTKRV